MKMTEDFGFQLKSELINFLKLEGFKRVLTFFDPRNQQKCQKKICKQPQLKKIGVCYVSLALTAVTCV